MKKISALLFFFLFITSCFAQSINGQWNGKLNVGVVNLRIVFHLQQDGEALKASMDSPDQNAAGIAMSSASFADSTLRMALAMAGIEFEGKLVAPDSISGTFKQMGRSFPLSLKRGETEVTGLLRPQEPKAPFPYTEEEVSFTNPKAGISLSGTLTKPKGDGPFPAIVLISGSGPQNRDEELFGHKPFAVIADYLTRQGIAVLRYDDRGTAKSGGVFASATSFDFATDAEAAFDFLKERADIKPGEIGLLGHSEGGMLAPLIASERHDVAFLVLLAGPGVRGDKLLLMQQEALGRTAGMDSSALARSERENQGAFELVFQTANTDSLKAALSTYLNKIIRENPNDPIPDGMTQEAFVNAQVNRICSPWMLGFIKYDPAPALRKVPCPVLAVNGEKDLQVPAEPNLDAIRKAMQAGTNDQLTTKAFPGLNHLFQPCTTGMPNEYGEIETTIAPQVLEYIADWIKKQVE